jgi:hypothetical protein
MAEFHIPKHLLNRGRTPSRLRPWPKPGEAIVRIGSTSRPTVSQPPESSDPSGRAAVCPVVRLMRVAHHEAGHAAISYATWPECRVEFATIIPGEGYLGLVRHAERGDEWRADVEDDSLAEAMAAESQTLIYLAGHEAEVRFWPEAAKAPGDFRWTPDGVGAQDSASGTCDGDADPLHHALAYGERLGALMDQPQVWRAITLTAAALLRQRTLTGSEVEAIVREAGIEPDRWREPLFWRSEDDPEDDDEAFSWERW